MAALNPLFGSYAVWTTDIAPPHPRPSHRTHRL